AGLLVSGLLLWLAAWLLDRISSASAQAEQPASQQAIVAAPPMGESAVAPAETGAATVQPAAASTPAADPVADVTVQLHFSESSWVEIYDAANRRLIYDIGQPGQTRTVAGVAPLRVTLGVASAVAVDVNQQSIPVPRRSGRDAARFTIWPDGSVR
ncbi:MAG TPA: RodZ domain-containing protein, partial [Povalibacter sp.]|nr:RodZ domain-containing protein [Povalibacter sp.]